MRGKERRSQHLPRLLRITPAYAGKSLPCMCNRPPRRDHPRLCGEKRSGGSTSSFVRGSPPPMRGKATRKSPVGMPPGITPAYAGKSRFITRCTVSLKDHPRLCGEKSGVRIDVLSDQGSPPPMRGKESSVDAGKYISKDHPRLCGEKLSGETGSEKTLGSPPPMRGKVKTCNIVRIFCRITPAYAGKSSGNRRTGCGIWDHPRLCGEK